MKTPILIAAASTALLGACATGPQDLRADPSFDPAATEFSGWVRVSGGEFQLYAEQRQLREPFARPCVSGALPRNAQRSADGISGQRVTFTGKTAPWSARDGVQSMRHEGSFIQNICRGPYVILADSVRVTG